MGVFPLLHRTFGPMPLARLAHTHAVNASADAFFAVSLAGSLFFNVSVDAARPQVILYLALTVAPFAVVAPLVGPLVDRFSATRTGVISLTMLVRGILCLFIASDLRNLFFYPEAFGVLVLSKAYTVTKSATVPGLVEDPQAFVAANSRLSRISSVTGAAGGAVAAGILSLGGAPAVLRVAALVYFAAAVLALRIPPLRERPEPPPELVRSETHTRPVILGASALTILRASIGFLTFLIAFGFRRAGEPLWLYGAVLMAVAIGNFAATLIAPIVRRRWLREEQVATVVLLAASVTAFLCAWLFGRISVVAAGLAVGLAAAIGRHAFDSLLQRDAPDATRGRYFARYETRFQLAWVIGALVPVTLSLSPRSGLIVLGVAFTIALAASAVGVSLEASAARRLRHVFGRTPKVGFRGPS